MLQLKLNNGAVAAGAGVTGRTPTKPSPLAVEVDFHFKCLLIHLQVLMIEDPKNNTLRT
jgi:hypothetical protein